ncbi:hypothetical protein [Acidovorax sp. sic0104]|uniref:hypothetical protein n=1 Tax=Acidovorax sp. sic0104 TaxID=2854784 RepID=UPI001C47FD3A|nr:hypothetical protein [Acidovorax sp. sic0104]MBV7542154.1 hypothetical protein [Acidovorax sp. sic0104]
MAETRNRLRVAYVGRDRASVPTVRVDLEYESDGQRFCGGTQRTFHRTDIADAQAKANELLAEGRVQEVREM